MNNLPLLNDLRVFMLVARRAGFAAVAEELGVSPAFVSKRIALLEQTLNVVLLHRTTRRVTITEEGERIYEWAQRILQDVGQMMDELSDVRQVPQGMLRIISSFGFGRQVVAPALSALAKAYPHVTMVARGARAESIRKKGLVLHSDYKGEIVAKPERVVPIQDMGQQDYIFICVKNYSLAEVCESIRDMVTDDTVIIPVMNGVDPGENIRRLVGKGTVVDSLIYTVAFANEDFSISQQDTFTWLCIGIKDADERQQKKVAEVAGILKGADIDYKDQRDIEVEIWRKYILNCAFNVMTAFYDNTIGELRRDPVKAQQYEKLVWEAASVGQAKGVALTDEHINEVIHKFRHVHADNATSSLQRDFRIRRKQTELETFSGYIVKEAKRLGVSIPLSEKIYQGLMEIAEKF